MTTDYNPIAEQYPVDLIVAAYLLNYARTFLDFPPVAFIECIR